MFQLLSHEEVLVEPQGDPGGPLVDLEGHEALRQGKAARLEQSAVHREARQLSRQLEDVEMLAAFVTDECL